jgi:branched-chain amino acid transport system ATP-binding protein
MSLAEQAQMLSVKALSAGYGKISVLSDINLTVNEGEMVALVGTNGSGKSTLLRTICGLVPVREGKIYFRGEEITGYRPEKRTPLGIALVPEAREIFAQQTVLANLKLGAYSRINWFGTANCKRELEFVISLFPHLRTRLGQMGATLSGGEQQMLAIGRALMSRPQLLILDEPSTGLAPLLVREIFRALLRLNQEMNLTILLVEQNTRAALKMVDRGYVIAKGRIACRGDAISLLEQLNREGLTYGLSTSTHRSDQNTQVGES